MKLKQIQENVSDNFSDKFVYVIQSIINLVTLIRSAKCYYHNCGLMSYNKYLNYVYKAYIEDLDWLMNHLGQCVLEIPELKIPKVTTIFEDTEALFKELSELEKRYMDDLDALTDAAFNDKNWFSFQYILSKKNVDKLLCNKGYNAILHKADILSLLPCESHS